MRRERVGGGAAAAAIAESVRGRRIESPRARAIESRRAPGRESARVESPAARLAESAAALALVESSYSFSKAFDETTLAMGMMDESAACTTKLSVVTGRLGSSR